MTLPVCAAVLVRRLFYGGRNLPAGEGPISWAFESVRIESFGILRGGGNNPRTFAQREPG